MIICAAAAYTVFGHRAARCPNRAARPHAARRDTACARGRTVYALFPQRAVPPRLRTVGRALTLAGREGCPAADTGHLLLAMLETDAGPAAEFLRGKRVTGSALRECTARRSCGAAPMRLGRRDLAPESRKALEFAQLGAQAARAPRAENEHLLCAMLEDCGCTASVWLAELGVEVPQAARECRQLSGQLVLPAQPRMSASRSSRPSEKYGRDLTRLAQEGQLDPVLCRDAELERMIEILWPPAEKQPLPAGRARRGQKCAGGGAGPAHRRGPGDPQPAGQAGAGAGHGVDGGGHQVPRRF